MKRFIAGTAATLAFGLGAGLGGAAIANAVGGSPSRTGTDPVPTQYVGPTVSNPCANEDGPGPCYWDAGQRGNHTGKSYILKNGYQYFIDGTRAVHN